jgi:hypothetical protein
MLLLLAASRQPVKGHSRQLLAALCWPHGKSKTTHVSAKLGKHGGTVAIEAAVCREDE